MFYWVLFPSLSLQVLGDVHAGRYIHGVAVHWYLDSLVPAEISLGTTHHLYPDYYLFGTEACAGWNSLDRGVKLGSWGRAEQYAHDIIEVRSYCLIRGGLCLFSQIHCKKTIWQAVSCSRKVSHLPLCCSAGLQVALRCTHSRDCRPAGCQSKLELVFCFFFLYFVSREIRLLPFSLFCMGEFRLQMLWECGGICLCRCTVLAIFKQNTSTADWLNYTSY